MFGLRIRDPHGRFLLSVWFFWIFIEWWPTKGWARPHSDQFRFFKKNEKWWSIWLIWQLWTRHRWFCSLWKYWLQNGFAFSFYSIKTHIFFIDRFPVRAKISGKFPIFFLVFQVPCFFISIFIGCGSFILIEGWFHSLIENFFFGQPMFSIHSTRNLYGKRPLPLLPMICKICFAKMADTKMADTKMADTKMAAILRRNVDCSSILWVFFLKENNSIDQIEPPGQVRIEIDQLGKEEKSQRKLERRRRNKQTNKTKRNDS